MKDKFYDDLKNDWQELRIKYAVELRNSRVESRSDDLTYIGLENIESGTGKIIGLNGNHVNDEKDVESNGVVNYFVSGDVLFSKLRPYLAKAFIAEKDGISTTELLVFKPKKTNRKFLLYLLLSPNFIKLIDSSTFGSRMPRADWTFIRDVFIPVPPLEEQRAIAEMLDRETKRLDELITQKERMVELLGEKRRALITKAVTGGLNPKIALVDSGVEWLGEIPQKWLRTKLKYVCSLLRDGTHLPPQRTKTGIPLLSVRNIVNESFVNLPDDSLISEEDYLELCRSFTVKPKDIVLAIVGATLGKVAVVCEMPDFHIQRSIAVFRAKKQILNYKFLAFVLRSKYFQSLLWHSVSFSAQPGIYLNSLQNFEIILPPLEEQQEIVEYIEAETGKIDRLQAATRDTIELLKERRSSLIAAAVTGKIGVANKSE